MHQFYQIVVREPKPGEFHLFNEKSGQFAGPRLRKGTNEKIIWPFKAGFNWMVHDSHAKAAKAAKELQDYLEAYEHNRGKSKKKGAE